MGKRPKGQTQQKFRKSVGLFGRHIPPPAYQYYISITPVVHQYHTICIQVELQQHVSRQYHAVIHQLSVLCLLETGESGAKWMDVCCCGKVVEGAVWIGCGRCDGLFHVKCVYLTAFQQSICHIKMLKDWQCLSVKFGSDCAETPSCSDVRRIVREEISCVKEELV